jgi:hypothetical protein
VLGLSWLRWSAAKPLFIKLAAALVEITERAGSKLVILNRSFIREPHNRGDHVRVASLQFDKMVSQSGTIDLCGSLPPLTDD